MTAPPRRSRRTVDVVLTGPGDKKIQVIKVVRAATGLGLKEAKALVDEAPKPVKEGIEREEADKLKADLEEAGGSVETQVSSVHCGRAAQVAALAFSPTLRGCRPIVAAAQPAGYRATYAEPRAGSVSADRPSRGCVPCAIFAGRASPFRLYAPPLAVPRSSEEPPSWPQSMPPGRAGRFARLETPLELPNLIDIQRKSFAWLTDPEKGGLRETIDDISPIEDYTGNLAVSSASSPSTSPLPRWRSAARRT